MLVLVGPSASGKSAIVKCLESKYGIKKFITCTTRPMRVGEVDKVDYYFMTKDEFNEHYINNEFIETVFYNGNYYGTLKKEAGINKVVILEPQGLKKFLEAVENIYSVFLYTNPDILKMRMINRGDSMLDVNKRLENDKILFSKEQLEKINLEIDTSNMMVDEIALKIINAYNEYLKTI